MTVDDVNLHDPATQSEWYPTYRRLRDEAPVYRMPGTNTYVVSRYADVLHVLRHQRTFPTGSTTYRTQAARDVFETKGWAKMTPLSANPPEHRHYRDIVDRFFDASGSLRWKGFIEATVSELLDEFEGVGTADLVDVFALPLPVRVITRILGLPAHDIPKLKAWSAAWVLPFSGGLSEAQEVWAAEQVVEFQHYLAEQIEERRRTPADDVLTALTNASFADARPLTTHEIITMTDHLFIGGNETTTFAITSAVWIMLREPGLYDLLREQRELLDPFIEESMRLESPTQGLFRLVAEDTEIDGVPVPAGAIVHIRYGSANRDERMFPSPDDVDLHRQNARRHMAFSLGEHQCPGHGLSRLEQHVALNAILDRLPDLRLADGNDFAHHPGFVLRALQQLHIKWSPSTSTDRA